MTDDKSLEYEIDYEQRLWEEHFRAEDAVAAGLGLPRPWHPHASREYLRGQILAKRAWREIEAKGKP